MKLPADSVVFTVKSVVFTGSSVVKLLADSVVFTLDSVVFTLDSVVKLPADSVMFTVNSVVFTGDSVVKLPPIHSVLFTGCCVVFTADSVVFTLDSVVFTGDSVLWDSVFTGKSVVKLLAAASPTVVPLDGCISVLLALGDSVKLSVIFCDDSVTREMTF